MTVHPLPTGLAAPAVRALHGTGIKSLEDLAHWTLSNLRQLHGVGPKALRKLEAALQEAHLTFPEEK